MDEWAHPEAIILFKTKEEKRRLAAVACHRAVLTVM